MKKMLLCAAIAVILVATAAAQDLYQLTYFSNRNNTAGLDQTTRLINPGVTGTPISADEGTLCANIYVFDSTQEMEECCSCPITANGILQESLLTNLTQNPLTGLPAPSSGVIKVVATTPAVGPVCGQETNLDGNTIPGLLGWQTHVQAPTATAFVVTEDGFKPANLTSGGGATVSERPFLSQTCAFVQYLGSGRGRCTCAAAS